MRIIAMLALVVALGASAPSAAGDADIPAARKTVEALNAAQLDAMRNAAKLGFKGRAGQLAGPLNKVYDFPEMVRIVTGSHWKSFSPEQKTRLIDAYARLSVAIYASRLTGYSGERFEVVGADVVPPPSPSILVRTRLFRTGGDEVRLDYRVRSADDGWRVVDVFYNGSVSELASQRSQYLAILGKEGYDGLLGTLERKIENLAAGKNG
ncbi:MAG: ABC transporter substrate-binding protein [Alphaproteobacteria bacterium]|nr:ABC transporter substrate-binding protein [Alphaproteobacteria bacterium]MBF0130320.1 ABC transporter substrate-binding protein [Alphaproteobacteria bacterium]